jgi:ferrous iron transport protein A
MAPADPKTMNTLLADLPDGALATVVAVKSNESALSPQHLRRLGELGFLPGEPVQVLHRGPGGREPLAVLVGDSMFALRLQEARCITVAPS